MPFHSSHYILFHSMPRRRPILRPRRPRMPSRRIRRMLARASSGRDVGRRRQAARLRLVLLVAADGGSVEFGSATKIDGESCSSFLCCGDVGSVNAS
ncbi:hypothetical protein T310_8116 [Rasamsonia emersonii CBS 393.64]|uniref:Uncharacterized protein n=1 Tax=Rasamsonia emersonii (strain ATCC 16479 / CBS 393.64 / IMI 116815) TaxID=1408163 RepID=A0A0F4YK16_RASE3|nr:hypothetical protein T310_8116 [Rasamsonia emersonii CBS 393.64]KKA17943.1 hypothetical protein T310_8116 [Rasamsonia emersonii CBS 393.64]